MGGMSAQDRASDPSRLTATSPVTAPTVPPVAPERSAADPSPTGHRAAAYFDLDKTILATSSTWALGTPMRRSGLISSRALAHGLIAQLPYLLVGAGARRRRQACGDGSQNRACGPAFAAKGCGRSGSRR